MLALTFKHTKATAARATAIFIASSPYLSFQLLPVIITSEVDVGIELDAETLPRHKLRSPRYVQTKVPWSYEAASEMSSKGKTFVFLHSRSESTQGTMRLLMHAYYVQVYFSVTYTVLY